MPGHAFWLHLLFESSARFPRATASLAGVMGRLAFHASAPLRADTLDNARHILGGDSPKEQARLAKRVIASHFRFCCDIALAARASRRTLLDSISSVEGEAHLAAARAQKRGLVVLTAHMGSFEVGLAGLARFEPRIHVVFKRDAFPRFDALRASLRNTLGVQEAPVDEGLATWLSLRDALQNDEVVVMQADRAMPGQKATRVAFFDGEIDMPLGPVKLAQTAGSPLIPIFALRRPDRSVRIVISEPLEPEEASVQKFARVLEKLVRDYPDEWLVLHRAWA